LHDLLVIGGGISGLSLAHLAARRGKSVLVLEKGARVGGCVATSRVDLPGAEPFWLELGSHTLYNSYAHVIGLIESCGLAGQVLPRLKLKFYMHEGGALRSIPGLLSYPELLVALPRLLTTRRQGNTIRGYYSRVLGEGNYGRVFQALFNAVACQDAGGLGVEYLFKRRPSRRKDFPRSFTLAGGIASLLDALAATPGVAVETGAEVAGVTREDCAFRARLADGTVRTASFLALAAPPVAGAALLEPCFPDIARLLAEIPVNRLYSIGVAVDRSEVVLPVLAGVVAASDRFYSVVSRDVVPHPTLRGFTFHFKDRDAHANLGRVREILGLPDEKPEIVRERENAIPSLVAGHSEHVRRIDAAAGGRNLLLTGNYFGGLSLEDCVARSAVEAARLA